MRARSVPYKRPYYVALFYSALFYLSCLATLSAFAGFLLNAEKFSAYLLAGCLLSSVILWFIGFLKRRHVRCALCQGTPYVDTGARYHSDASKLPVMNYGQSNLVRSLVTLRFRCMFCGTAYDFLKPSSQKHTQYYAPGSPNHKTSAKK
ncbi:MAG: hypothetical protein ACQKBY_12170 [Verrucomicrobiales bacterium]